VNLAIMRRLTVSVLAVFATLTAGSGIGDAADEIDRAKSSSSAEVARQVDASLDVELSGQAVPSPTARIADDETFLRRASQDLVGELPTPEEVTAFVLDRSADKRAKLVDRLLANSGFGQNWARYFRDVILYRRTDERALLVGPSMVTFLANQFNKGVGWDMIARAFITAQGDVREQGDTGLIMAQMGQAPEIAAETARIFLGVQIQCAQCHDHPTDRWKRTQFHELAAFFPRLAIRPLRDGERRSFEVVSRDFAGGRPRNNGKPRGPTEHYMPDLNDPTAKGTLMQPVFFVSGQKLAPGAGRR